MYRDPLASLKARCLENQGRLRSQLTRFSPAYLRTEPGRQLARAAACLERAPGDDDLQSWLAWEAALGALESLQQQRFHELPEVEASWTYRSEAPLPVEALDPEVATSDWHAVGVAPDYFPPLVNGFEELRRLRYRNLQILSVSAWAPTYSFLVPHEGRQVPVTSVTSVHGQQGNVLYQLIAPARRGVPRIRMRHERFWHRWTEREIRIGNPTIDDLFLIQAEADEAPLFFRPALCAALIALTRHDIPRLELGPGRASIVLRDVAVEAVFGLGVQLLCHMTDTAELPVLQPG